MKKDALLLACTSAALGNLAKKCKDRGGVTCKDTPCMSPPTIVPTLSYAAGPAGLKAWFEAEIDKLVPAATAPLAPIQPDAEEGIALANTEDILECVGEEQDTITQTLECIAQESLDSSQMPDDG